jgi:hypothetical protein
MTKLLVMLLVLTAAWIGLLLAGYAAVRILQLLFRVLTAVLAGLILGTAAAGSLLTTPVRGAIGWAIRRLEPSRRASPESAAPAVAAPVVGAPPPRPAVRAAGGPLHIPMRIAVAAPPPPDADAVVFISACGHLNRGSARYCGRCGAALNVGWADADGEIVYLDESPLRRV